MLRQFIILFLYFLILCQVSFCQEQAVSAEEETLLGIEAQARQVRVYREALLQGSTEDIRVEAAVGLLLQNTAESRNVLLTALKSEDNVAASSAVCKALIRSRAVSQKIDAIDAFREPLLMILQRQSGELAKQAAEALLLYDSDEIFSFLQSIIKNTELPVRQRINAVYALQLRPEPSALRQLIGLLDSPEPDVSKAAETALQDAFGIPVGTSRKVWSDILTELQLKSPEEIRKERLLRQEMKLRDVQTERDRWQRLYLQSLDKQYDPLDETGRTAMILEKMDSDLYPIRLWALDKAAKYPTLGDPLRNRILLLLSDVSRDVRLQTAKVLMNMSALNPGQALLGQFEQEKDSEVRLAMFEALGEAVFYAFLPDTNIELSTDIKAQTLSIAADYLQSESPEAAIKGAEVVRKILELNSLDKNLVQGYLELLHKRYMESLTQGGAFRAEMLGILARLCGQGGAKAAACVLYEPLFLEALASKDNPALRLAAAQGLSYVDKVKALEIFKQYELTQDDNLAVKHVVIDVAGQTGDVSDLVWLVESLSNNGNSEYAWNAIKKICQRQPPAFLLDWIENLEAAVGTKNEYVREILDIAEQKAVGAKDEEILHKVRMRTIQWFWNRSEWENGAAYLAKINYLEIMPALSEDIDLKALEIYLNTQAWTEIGQMIQVKLSLSAYDDVLEFCGILEDFFENPDVSTNAKFGLFKILETIKTDQLPDWNQFIDRISLQLGSGDPESSPDVPLSPGGVSVPDTLSVPDEGVSEEADIP